MNSFMVVYNVFMIYNLVLLVFSNIMVIYDDEIFLIIINSKNIYVMLDIVDSLIFYHMLMLNLIYNKNRNYYLLFNYGYFIRFFNNLIDLLMHIKNDI